jgi:hypothetical protein
VSYELVVRQLDDGSCCLVGDAPERIRVARELLDCADPAVMAVQTDGGVLFTLANATLRYRRVGPVEGGLSVEFERVA